VQLAEPINERLKLAESGRSYLLLSDKRKLKLPLPNGCFAQESGRWDLLWFSLLKAIYSRSNNLYTFKLFDVFGWSPNGRFCLRADIRSSGFLATVFVNEAPIPAVNDRGTSNVRLG
jgi:hypothetical protein